MTQEEFDKKKEEQAEKRKARKNNGAKRDMHYEMKAVSYTHLLHSLMLAAPILLMMPMERA